MRGGLAAGAANKLAPGAEQTPRRQVLARVDAALYNAARKEMKRNRLTVTEVVEWGIREFLLQTNPKRAKKFGIDKPAATAPEP